jgi:hypothetical protein
MRRVAAILNAVALAPLVDGLRVCRENVSLDRFLILRTPDTFRKNCPCVIAALNGRSDLRGRRRLTMKMDQHGRSPIEGPSGAILQFPSETLISTTSSLVCPASAT